MSTRYRKWLDMEDNFDKNKNAHELFLGNAMKQFNQTYVQDATHMSDAEKMIFSKFLKNCGCTSCYDYYIRKLFETQLELTKFKKKYISKTKIHNICTECSQPAKSNKATICESKDCEKSRKAKQRKEKVQLPKPVTAICVICKQKAKTNKAKICNLVACYNANHTNVRNIRLAKAQSEKSRLK
jgi:hypothetical protein